MELLANGGARSRRIVNWNLVYGVKGKGKGGINALQPIDQIIPQHDVVKFRLTFAPGGGTMVGAADRLEAILSLDLGEYEELVRFELLRSDDVFLLDAFRTPMLWEPRGWRKRLRYALGKRLP
jgi:hypothetical protein